MICGRVVSKASNASVTDSQEGILAALREQFPAPPRQRRAISETHSRNSHTWPISNVHDTRGKIAIVLDHESGALRELREMPSVSPPKDVPFKGESAYTYRIRSKSLSHSGSQPSIVYLPVASAIKHPGMRPGAASPDVLFLVVSYTHIRREKCPDLIVITSGIQWSS